MRPRFYYLRFLLCILTALLPGTQTASGSYYYAAATAGSSDHVTAGLVVWYRFDEGTGTTVADSSGNGNTGTFSALGVTWTTSNGTHGAVTFDGTVGFITLANTLSGLGTGAKSIAWWAKPTDNGDANERIFSQADGTDWSMRIRYSGVDNLEVYTGSGFRTVVAVVPAVNLWTHYAVTWDGAGNMTGYVNGVADATVADDAMVLSGVFAIGLPLNAGFGNFFTGDFHDFRGYNRTITAGEVLEIKNNP